MAIGNAMLISAAVGFIAVSRALVRATITFADQNKVTDDFIVK
jgi:hypothetical protein